MECARSILCVRSARPRASPPGEGQRHSVARSGGPGPPTEHVCGCTGGSLPGTKNDPQASSTLSSGPPTSTARGESPKASPPGSFPKPRRNPHFCWVLPKVSSTSRTSRFTLQLQDQETLLRRLPQRCACRGLHVVATVSKTS